MSLTRSQGEKVLDDPKLLKKTLKRKQKAKQKSRKQWYDCDPCLTVGTLPSLFFVVSFGEYREERKELTEQKKKAKQEKRQTNLQQRKTKGGKNTQVRQSPSCRLA
eukprot:gb/GECG01015958.1/.p1 GENE.gb/GECG01015958.1/~~gb/GECG01015958.1/.p1  ORF type:complete len:106 (+),score=21.74 gb/GECG01015958.1/:1-318(+)